MERIENDAKKRPLPSENEDYDIMSDRRFNTFCSKEQMHTFGRLERSLRPLTMPEGHALSKFIRVSGCTDSSKINDVFTLLAREIYNLSDIEKEFDIHVSHGLDRSDSIDEEDVEIIRNIYRYKLSMEGCTVPMHDCEKDCIRGSIQERFLLAESYINSKSYESAFRIFLDLAKDQHTESQYYLGLMYANGYGTRKSNKSALWWFERASENGSAGAQFSLAMMYWRGIGTDKKPFRAFKLMKDSAMNGEPRAQAGLATMYSRGEGTKPCSSEALHWFTESANSGYDQGQFGLGSLYQYGIGVEKSLSEAYKWYLKAAEQGHSEAQYNIGRFYDEGTGVEQSFAEAGKWYSLSAKNGNAKAMYCLGVLYELGAGRAQSPVMAMKLYRSALKYCGERDADLIDIIYGRIEELNKEYGELDGQ